MTAIPRTPPTSRKNEERKRPASGADREMMTNDTEYRRPASPTRTAEAPAQGSKLVDGATVRTVRQCRTLGLTGQHWLAGHALDAAGRFKGDGDRVSAAEGRGEHERRDAPLIGDPGGDRCLAA